MALDAAGPPHRDVHAVLADLRRGNRRRLGHWSAAGLGAVLVVGAAVVVVRPGPPAVTLARPAASPSPPAATTPTGPPATPTGQPEPPTGDRKLRYAVPELPRVAQAHGREVARILIAAAPSGFHTGDHLKPATHTVKVSRGSGTGIPKATTYEGYTTSTDLTLLGDDGSEGRLSSDLTQVVERPVRAPLCSERLRRYFARTYGGPPGWQSAGRNMNCERITVDGVPIQVTTVRAPVCTEAKWALRMFRNGYLVVAWRFQCNQPDGGDPGVDTPAFTSRQLADLAADPALLP
jgi:hypothetical protein